MKKLFLIMMTAGAMAACGGGDEPTGGTGGTAGTGGTGGAECGNGDIDSGEQCDGTNLNGKTCNDALPGSTGTLACNDTCDGFVTTGCTTAPSCGDTTKNGTEQCDTADLGTVSTCSDIDSGYTGGTPTCNADCTYNVSSCTGTPNAVCGNNTKDGAEQCDGLDFGGLTCDDAIAGSTGALECNATCDGIITTGCQVVSNSCVAAQEGHRRCNGDTREQCVGGTWGADSIDDCTGSSCVETTSTDAVCMMVAGVGEECDFGATIGCDTGLLCVPINTTDAICLTDCAGDATACGSGEYCDDTGFFGTYVGTTPESATVCWYVSDPYAPCVWDAAPPEACSGTQECITDGRWNSADGQITFVGFSCRDLCSGADVGTTGGCPADPAGVATTCEADQSGWVDAAYEYYTGTTATTCTADSECSGLGAAWICTAQADGTGACSLGCDSTTTDTCATDTGSNYTCGGVVTIAGAIADGCRRPRGVCGNSLPYVDTFTDAGLSAADNCNDWNVRFDATLGGYYGPPNLCADNGAGNAPNECVGSGYLSLYYGGINCDDATPCPGSSQTCIDLDGDPNNGSVSGVCSCVSDADCGTDTNDVCYDGSCVSGCLSDYDCMWDGLVCYDIGLTNGVCSNSISYCIAWCEDGDGANEMSCPSGDSCLPHDYMGTDTSGNPVLEIDGLAGEEGVIFEGGSAAKITCTVANEATDCTTPEFACNTIMEWNTDTGEQEAKLYCSRARKVCQP